MSRLEDLFPGGYPEGLDWDALDELFGGRDLDDLTPGDLTLDRRAVRERLEQLSAEVRAGEEAQRKRAAVLRLTREADPRYWTQDMLADICGISQAAVSKALSAAPRPPAATQPAYLAGRLAAVAEAAAGDNGRSGRLAAKMLGGSWPVNQASIAVLARLAERDIGSRRENNVVREAAAEITGLLAEALAGAESIVMTIDNHADMFAGYHAERRWLKGR